jgi:hypothetical protein
MHTNTSNTNGVCNVRVVHMRPIHDEYMCACTLVESECVFDEDYMYNEGAQGLMADRAPSQNTDHFVNCARVKCPLKVR